MSYRQSDPHGDKGYGVILAGASRSFKKNAEIDLMNVILTSECKSLTKQFEKYCQENEFSPEGEVGKRSFVGDFEDRYGCGDGIGGLLAVFFNETECGGQSFFYYNDCCLYATAYVPDDEESRATIPTQKDVRRIFEKYLNPLLVSPLAIDWVFPEY